MRLSPSFMVGALVFWSGYNKILTFTDKADTDKDWLG
jgi:hypothetical protein